MPNTHPMELAAAVVGGLLLILSGVVADRLILHRQVGVERRVQRREAAEAVLPGLRKVRQLVRDASTSRDAKAWADAVWELFPAIDTVLTRLPDSWAHVERSVRAAIGEVAGPVVLSDLDPDLRSFDVVEYDRLWAAHAEEYLDYVIHRIQIWRDEPKRGTAAPPELLHYDAWLYDTGRVDYAPLGRRRRRRRLP